MTPKKIVERATRMKAERGTFDAHCQMVADYIMPSREFTQSSTPGTRSRQNRIMNDTPIAAAEQLAGGLHGMLTSPALRWFKLRAPKSGRGHNGGPEWGEDDGSEQWFDSVTEAMFATFNSPKAGFDTAAHELYMDITGFGNGCIFVGDTGVDGPTFQSVPLSECYIGTTGAGRVDTLYRIFKWTARQIIQTWSEIGSSAVRAAAEKNPEQKFEIIHAVVPKENDARGEWKYESCYVLTEGLVEIERGGFLEFPYVFARWSRRSGEDYGYGPAMQALPSIRQLNSMEAMNLKALSKAVDPPQALPDDGFLAPLNMNPGAINYYRSGENMKDRILSLGSNVRPDYGIDMIDRLEQRIRVMFYVTWMNLPTQPNMTATEVLQRRDEQLRLLGPMVARLQQEFLGPLIERTFAIMARNSLIPAPPISLEKYEVEYQSPLALSQKASDAESVLRWFAAVAQVAQIEPKAADQVDVPKAIRFLADRYGVPAAVIRDAAEAQALGDARDEAAQQMQQTEMAQGLAGAAQQGAGAMKDLAMAQPQGIT